MNLHKEGIVVLNILDTVCVNFPISEEDRVNALKEFQNYLPDQDPQDLRKMLIKIHNDLQSWSGEGDGVKVIKGLYNNICKGLKNTPLSGRAGFVRGFVWAMFSREIKRPELKPMIAVTIFQIQEILGVYVGSGG